MTMQAARERLVFPVDVPTLGEAEALIARLRGQDGALQVGVLKVGLELFVSAGPDAVRLVHASGARCFLDLKLHDIPETMARATRAAAALGVSYLTVHASAGETALKRVSDAARGTSLTVLAVTALTSLSTADVKALGVGEDVQAWTERLADLAQAADIGGLVCSPRECRVIRASLGKRVVLVTPGIRPENAAADDQVRTATPAHAVREGADLLVVGRPIRDAADPASAAREIVRQIAAAAGSL